MGEIKEKISLHHEGDEKQLEVIFSENPRIIVEAPAGYGKTTTMISRIAYLYAIGGIPNPKKVLGLTFSVNAALKVKREVAGKLPKILGGDNNPIAVDDRVTVTNFHGFCKTVLRKYGYLKSELLRKDINLLHAYGKAEIEKRTDIQNLMSSDEWLFIKKIETSIENSILPSMDEIEKYNDIVLKKLVIMDYITHDAVILLTLELFNTFQKIREFYSNYYPLIVVDEFQDSNCIAWDLLKALISDKTQLLFLGDPLQRIYGFIGAMPNIMANATDEYNMKQISLNKNYRFRSNLEMLKLDANIRENAATFFKPHIKEVAKLPAFWGIDQSSECNAVLEKVEHIQEKFPQSKIAILFRARGDNAGVFEHKLQEKKIDYFYGMYTDEDQEYVNFHNYCWNCFITKFGRAHTVSKRQLLAFVKMIESTYESKDAKATSSLLELLRALIVKVSVDYENLRGQEKYELILDVFENRQLKQALEYIHKNLILSTVHGAKGLEWDYVFVADLERFIFPAFTCYGCPQRFSEPINCKCVLPCTIPDNVLPKILDELSVFYVAITRARKQAYVSASKTRANGKTGAYSCYAAIDGISLIDGNKQ